MLDWRTWEDWKYKKMQICNNINPCRKWKNYHSKNKGLLKISNRSIHWYLLKHLYLHRLMSPLFSKNEVFLDSNVFSEHNHARHAKENNLAMLLKVLSHSRCHFKSINQPLRQHSVVYLKCYWKILQFFYKSSIPKLKY